MITINLFSLVASLTLDDEEYKRKIDEAKAKGEELANDTQKKHSAKMVAGWMAVATAIIAVIKQLANLAIETAKYADQVGDLAEKWGFASKEIQEFDYWATQNGTTLESLMTGMRGLVNQAQAGSDAFAKLGVSVKNADGTLKDQRTLFLETITALQKVKNQTERNALQFDIFGRSGIELGQIINKTGDELEALSQKAEDYGLIISESAIKASSDFVDELDTMQRQFRNVIAELLTGGKDADENMRKFVDNLCESLEKYLPVFLKFAYNLWKQVLEQLPKLIEPLLETFTEELIDYLASLDWLTLTFKLIVAIVKGVFNGVKNVLTKLFSGELFSGETFNVSEEQTTNAISTVTSANVSEKTTRVDEKLDITLSVESDGTVAGEKNLDIISDMLTDKINKALGDMVNG